MYKRILLPIDGSVTANKGPVPVMLVRRPPPEALSN